MNRILIVEDDKTIAKLIQASLSISDYETFICYDGQAAYQYIMQNDLDLILLDVMLPGMDGFSLFEKIRCRNIPVIFLTAKGELSDRVKGLRLGADDYIVKPFEPLELLARIETVLRRYHKEEQLLTFGNITVHLQERKVRLNGTIVDTIYINSIGVKRVNDKIKPYARLSHKMQYSKLREYQPEYYQ